MGWVILDNMHIIVKFIITCSTLGVLTGLVLHERERRER